ncbi:pantoate-beta-alanine ligase [Trichodelitschia bisporula]|uniref:Pantoate--beta-alanine ligase n=1 Tax=Trichodelitschia bisporula TaxID=703511 RepID=A0A6G1HL00_9PEZI|nr:pantoate-beta-alanine ligase [Trichodelitschia bisporula]
MSLAFSISAALRTPRRGITYFAIARSRQLFSTSKAVADTSPLQVFHGVPPLRSFRRSLLFANRTVGLVPTMGALHDGHLSLVRQAAAENTDVFVSIYVNPTQFGINEDLTTYPKTWESDVRMLNELQKELDSKPGSGKISAIFAPSTNVMYPTLPPSSEINGKGSFVTITPVAELLEGASRPVFFRGVATVCMKLFNIVEPERVYFGQKDVQQTVVIKRMVKDFYINTEVRIGPTRREEDGLAMSSRNVYLGARRRKVGVVLSRALRAAAAQYAKGERSRSGILWPANDVVNQEMLKQDDLPAEQRARFEVDYISLADPDTLEEVEEIDERGAILSGAIKMLPLEAPQEGEDTGLGGGHGPVRLIDNIIIKPVS